MIKWGEFRDGDALFEAFLPEHDAEAQEWLLRTSRLGHIVDERRIPLVWPPRFGPDTDDVAALEAELDVAIARAAAATSPTGCGSYSAVPCEMLPADPLVHAGLYGLLEEYVAAEQSLRLTRGQSTQYLDLPVGALASGLYPGAITPRREARMRRLVALSGLAARHPAVADRTSELIAALSSDDLECVTEILRAAGIDVDGDGRVQPELPV